MRNEKHQIYYILNDTWVNMLFQITEYLQDRLFPLPLHSWQSTAILTKGTFLLDNYKT